MLERVKYWLRKIAIFFLNPRFLLCFGIAWMLTNGWSYILFALGTYFGIGWMAALGGSYMAFLWLPISPEKIVTVAIAIWLLKFLFPNDQKTLAVLIRVKKKIQTAVKNKKKKK